MLRSFLTPSPLLLPHFKASFGPERKRRKRLCPETEHRLRWWSSTRICLSISSARCKQRSPLPRMTSIGLLLKGWSMISLRRNSWRRTLKDSCSSNLKTQLSLLPDLITAECSVDLEYVSDRSEIGLDLGSETIYDHQAEHLVTRTAKKKTWPMKRKI